MDGEKFEQTVQSALESGPLKGLGLKLLGIGAEKMVFETPGSVRKVIKVGVEDILVGIMLQLGIKIDDKKLADCSLKKIIDEHQVLEKELIENFGQEHLLRNGVFKTKVPITKELMIQLFSSDQEFELVRPSIDSLEDGTILHIEVLAETQVVAEELKDPEKYKTKDLSTYLMIEDDFRNSADIPTALSYVRHFVDKDFVGNFEDNFSNAKEVEIVREIITNIIKFTKKTGLMVDIFGPNNITIFTKEDGSVDYHLPDVILPGPQRHWVMNIKDDPEFDLLRHYYTFYYSIKSLADKLGISNNLDPEDLVYFKGTGIPIGGKFPNPREV